ncbi:hypothetical protein PII48_24570 [Serratia sp. 21NM0010]|nr:hypothetical protein [Serratia sp. 21NM0010]MDB6452034.1 hypothetical protein [Serratia sp. 21NM0010]
MGQEVREIAAALLQALVWQLVSGANLFHTEGITKNVELARRMLTLRRTA